MQSAITRRKALTTVAALAAVTAVPATTLAMTAEAQSDAELRRLWSQYLDHLRTERAARGAHKPAYTACMAKAQERFPGNGFMLKWPREEFEQLWRSFDMDRLCDVWHDAATVLDGTIAAIRATPAEGLVGIGIKLAVMDPEPAGEAEDYEEGMDSALADIARLTGVDLAAEVEAVQS